MCDFTPGGVISWLLEITPPPVISNTIITPQRYEIGNTVTLVPTTNLTRVGHDHGIELASWRGDGGEGLAQRAYYGYGRLTAGTRGPEGERRGESRYNFPNRQFIVGSE